MSARPGLSLEYAAVGIILLGILRDSSERKRPVAVFSRGKPAAPDDPGRQVLSETAGAVIRLNFQSVAPVGLTPLGLSLEACIDGDDLPGKAIAGLRLRFEPRKTWGGSAAPGDRAFHGRPVAPAAPHPGSGRPDLTGGPGSVVAA